MRKLLGVALTLALAGCAAKAELPQPGPQGNGAYELIAVENFALPQFMSSGPNAGREVVEGRLFLRPDNTFQMQLMLATQVSALEPLKYERTFTGSYTSSEIGVNLIWADGRTSSGAFFGRTLRIYSEGVEYLFMK